MELRVAVITEIENNRKNIAQKNIAEEWTNKQTNKQMIQQTISAHLKRLRKQRLIILHNAMFELMTNE